MGNTTGREALKSFCRCIAKSHLRDEYLQNMTRADAKRVSALHEREFGVAGCLGCLDCMHVYWRTCPMVWHGQFEGKEGVASMVLEAVADYTTWIWHAKFGYPGTLNDINIWDQSVLLRSYLDGTHSSLVDFPFSINKQKYTKLWVLVDGIYPEISRFVKTISVPIGKSEKAFARWQEACRKSVERAFGVLQRKFQILTRPMELWYQDDIRNIVDTTIILHNMMVEVRLSRDQVEASDWYEMEAEGTETNNDNSVHIPQEEAQQEPPIVERQEAVQATWSAALKHKFAAAQLEWDGLYNRDSHFALRASIVAQLESGA
jgi:hypothetical protein